MNNELAKKIIQEPRNLKTFLETYSLYKKYRHPLAGTKQELKFLPIQLYCPNHNCKGERTFSYDSDDSDVKIENRKVSFASPGGIKLPGTELKGQTYKFTYICQSCTNQKYKFLITFGDGYAYKSGQEPSLGMIIEKQVEIKLGAELAKHFKNGRTCEEHGLGIGAMAYYRRVVEDKINELLDEVLELAEESEKGKLSTMLEEVKKPHTFEERANLVSDLIPNALKPGGQNVVKLIFSKLSDGLHSKENEVCLQIAQNTRQLLELMIQILNQQTEARKMVKELSKNLAKT